MRGVRVKVLYEDKEAELDLQSKCVVFGGPSRAAGRFLFFPLTTVLPCRSSLEKDVIPQAITKLGIGSLPVKWALRNGARGLFWCDLL